MPEPIPLWLFGVMLILTIILIIPRSAQEIWNKEVVGIALAVPSPNPAIADITFEINGCFDI